MKAKWNEGLDGAPRDGSVVYVRESGRGRRARYDQSRGVYVRDGERNRVVRGDAWRQAPWEVAALSDAAGLVDVGEAPRPLPRVDGPVEFTPGTIARAPEFPAESVLERLRSIPVALYVLAGLALLAIANIFYR